MSWSPDLDISNDLKITLDQYEQQEAYGLTSMRPGRVPLNVDPDVYHNEVDLSTLRLDVRAELELAAYRRKLECPVKHEKRQWTDEQPDEEGVETEISRLIRKVGIDREPSVNFRLNSKTTARTAIKLDRLPVTGVKNVFLTPDHFKFENPFFKSKMEPSTTATDDSYTNGNSSECASSSSANEVRSGSFNESKVGLPNQEYVSPAALYMKARRNRR